MHGGPQPIPRQALMLANGMDACRDTDMHTHTLMLKRCHGRADTAWSDIRPGSAKSAGDQILVMVVIVIRITANVCGVPTHSSIVLRTLHTLILFSPPNNSISHQIYYPILKTRKLRSVELRYLPKIAEQILVHFSGPLFPHRSNVGVGDNLQHIF